MTAYLSFEWLKLSKRWMPRIILILLLGLLAVGFWGQGSRGETPVNLFLPRGVLSALVYSALFAPFFWPVLGGSWSGNEYGWGTIRMVLTRRPHRIEQALAALIVLLVGLVIALIGVLLVGVVAGALVGVLTGNSAYVSGVLTGSFAGTLIKTFLAAWYVGAFYLILSYACATIFRSAAVGIGAAIGSSLAEFVLRRIFIDLGGFWATIANHFPVLYTSDLATRVASAGLVPGYRPTYDPAAPGIQESLIALGIFIAVLLVATVGTVRARDITA